MNAETCAQWSMLEPQKQRKTNRSKKDLCVLVWRQLCPFFGGGGGRILVLFLEFEIKCPFLHFQKKNLACAKKHQNQDTFFTSLSLLCLGVFLFILGMGINIHSDYVLRQLRKPGEVIYQIPQGNVSPALQIPTPPREPVPGIMR